MKVFFKTGTAFWYSPLCTVPLMGKFPDFPICDPGKGSFPIFLCSKFIFVKMGLHLLSLPQCLQSHLHITWHLTLLTLTLIKMTEKFLWNTRLYGVTTHKTYILYILWSPLLSVTYLNLSSKWRKFIYHCPNCNFKENKNVISLFSPHKS